MTNNTKLEGDENFRAWKFIVLLIIEEHDLENYVKGEVAEPEGDEDRAKHKKNIVKTKSCWLWSLIFQIQRYYSVVLVPQVYCTLIPPALVNLANSFADPWYWVNRSIFPWYFPYKIKAL